MLFACNWQPQELEDFEPPFILNLDIPNDAPEELAKTALKNWVLKDVEVEINTIDVEHLAPQAAVTDGLRIIERPDVYLVTVTYGQKIGGSDESYFYASTELKGHPEKQRAERIKDNAVEGLTEFYPELTDQQFALKIKGQLIVPDTGNDQEDYENVRDQVERIIDDKLASGN